MYLPIQKVRPHAPSPPQTSVSEEYCAEDKASSQRPPIGLGGPFLNILVNTVKVLLKLNTGMKKALSLQFLVLYPQHLVILPALIFNIYRDAYDKYAIGNLSVYRLTHLFYLPKLFCVFKCMHVCVFV